MTVTALILTVLGSAAGALALYLILGAYLPYLVRRSLTEQERSALDPARLYGDGTPCLDRVKLVEAQEEGFTQRVRLIREARETLDVSVYRAEDSPETDALLGELIQAARRGVKVHFLIDAKTGALTRENAEALFTEPNVLFRVYAPFRLFRPWEWAAALHDKYIVADNRFLLTGGRNFGRRFFTSAPGEATYDRDVLVCNTGSLERSVLSEVRRYMDRVLAERCVRPRFSRLSSARRTRGAARANALADAARAVLYDFSADLLSGTLPARKVRFLNNPTHPCGKRPYIGWQLKMLAARAERSVVVQNPYASAAKRTLSAFRSAARLPRAIYVTNSAYASPNPPAIGDYLAHRRAFAKTGVRIFEYQGPDSIHGKSFVFDGRLSVTGSFNLDERSVYVDTETMLAIDSPEFSETLLAAIDAYRAKSVELTENGRYPKDAQAPRAKFGKRVLLKLCGLLARVFRCIL